MADNHSPFPTNAFLATLTPYQRFVLFRDLTPALIAELARIWKQKQQAIAEETDSACTSIAHEGEQVLERVLTALEKNPYDAGERAT